MRFVTIIPARGGSKRLPGKNILPLAGKPLIAHSILYSKSECPDIEVYVSTDSEEIADIAYEYGVKVIERPERESSDTATTGDVLCHSLLHFQAENVYPEYLITLQPTNPLRPLGMLRRAIKLVEEMTPDSLFSVSPIKLKQGRIIENRFLSVNYKFGMRSQDMDTWYYENELLYLTRENIASQGKTITENAYPMIIDHIYGRIDIDTKEDFNMAEFFFSQELND